MKKRLEHGEINSLYARLNAVRAKHKMSLLSPPNKNKSQIILAEDVNSIKNEIKDTGRRGQYLPDSPGNIDDVSVGDLILETTLVKIDTALKDFEGRCYHRSSHNSSYDGSYDGGYRFGHHYGNYSVRNDYKVGCYAIKSSYKSGNYSVRTNYNGSVHRVDFDRN